MTDTKTGELRPTDSMTEETQVDEMLKPLLSTINESPELTSLLYAAEMLPEQCRTRVGALHLLVVVGLWLKLKEQPAQSGGRNETVTVDDLGGWIEHGLRYGVSSKDARTAARQLLGRFNIALMESQP